MDGESLKNGSSSIIGIGPGHSLQQGDNFSANQYFGSLGRPLDNTTPTQKVNSSLHEQNINTMPLNRINNIHQRNSIYQTNPTVELKSNEEPQNTTMNASMNHSLSQTPPPPPMPPIQPLASSKANFSGMGTHV